MSCVYVIILQAWDIYNRIIFGYNRWYWPLAPLQNIVVNILKPSEIPNYRKFFVLPRFRSDLSSSYPTQSKVVCIFMTFSNIEMFKEA